MISPDSHEDAAASALSRGDTAEATVLALLALASAVNRLADAQTARI
jgi:hypothetical protein